jgi:hypothetical protein
MTPSIRFLNVLTSHVLMPLVLEAAVLSWGVLMTVARLGIGDFGIISAMTPSIAFSISDEVNRADATGAGGGSHLYVGGVLCSPRLGVSGGWFRLRNLSHA